MLKTLLLFLAGGSFTIALLGVLLGLPGLAALGFFLTAVDLALAFYFPGAN